MVQIIGNGFDVSLGVKTRYAGLKEALIRGNIETIKQLSKKTDLS